MPFFFLDSLFFKEHYVKFSIFFSVDSTGWNPIQPVHRASLCRTLILVILEPKSYMDWAHKLQFSFGQYFGSILDFGLGYLQPIMNPYGSLVVKQAENLRE